MSRRGNIESAGNGGRDSSAVIWQVLGGPPGCQREEAGQVPLDTGEQGAQLGYAQLDHRTVALLDVHGEPDGVAEALRRR
ncbi:hypothetical protein [Streptomyces sp. Je 1-369]|uniref:hypothetical protein n=1 Tax=Streptomyces sp. Je 1-369 TaxID=2966192 RepID=UPI002AA2A8DB|nr:hypothetical protein [Streptomyces sp. Je 1-369]